MTPTSRQAALRTLVDRITQDTALPPHPFKQGQALRGYLSRMIAF
jgi:hypothetical protein